MASYEAELIRDGHCPEIVPVMTEDGPSDGRCFQDVVPGGYACPGHTAEIESWRAMTEAEKAHWERSREWE